MATIDKAFIMRLKQGKQTIEILVDFDALKEYQNGSITSVYDVVADTQIFVDSKKGELAKEDEIKALTGTDNEEQALKVILDKGECQIPTAYLQEQRKLKKTQILNYICENATNPQTGGKYTPSMIESTFEQLHFNIELNKSIEHQAQDVLKLLYKHMPIAIEHITMKMQCNAMYAGAFYGNFRTKYTVKKENYTDNGDMVLHIQCVRSKQDDLIEYIKKSTHESGEYSLVD